MIQFLERNAGGVWLSGTVHGYHARPGVQGPAPMDRQITD